MGKASPNGPPRHDEGRAVPRLARATEWAEYAKGQELRAEAAEARVAELEEALLRVIDELTQSRSLRRDVAAVGDAIRVAHDAMMKGNTDG